MPTKTKSMPKVTRKAADESALRARIRELESRLVAQVAAPLTPEGSAVPVVDPRLLKLDLGCGQTVAEGFRGVDLYAPEAEFKVDLCSGEHWPWEDSSVDGLRCSHFIEHIPMDRDRHGVDRLIAFFNEAWRVAKPGAPFELQWPALQSVRAFMDPTHRRFIPVETMLYLSKQWRTEQKLDHYLGATCDWVMVSGTSTMLQPDALLPDLVQQRRFRESWNFAHDHVVVLKANKP
jgi:predicted SAM-dependent methyltransferase